MSRRRIIIVAPHFPPSNLPAVHRARLLCNHLPEFGWDPIVVTVHHRYYEEELDWDLVQLVAEDLRVERVSALPTRPIRVIGDVGIRGFAPMLKRILDLVDEVSPDFLYVTVPSFLAAPLGRLVHELRGVPYGIDYIDPWVHVWPGSEKPLTKAWLSRMLGRFLEPHSVAQASLISGVAEGYFQGVMERNPKLTGTAVTVAMPYGAEYEGFEVARRLGKKAYLFETGNKKVFNVVYAGGIWPAAFETLEAVFGGIAGARDRFEDVKFHFIGTSSNRVDPLAYQVREFAERHQLWGHIVQEHPAWIPYLDVLTHLEAADAVFVLGSSEPHYTPSKIYQAILSRRPVLAVLHAASTGCRVVEAAGAGTVLAFDGGKGLQGVRRRFVEVFEDFRCFASRYESDPAQMERALEPFSARTSARLLAEALNEALGTPGRA